MDPMSSSTRLSAYFAFGVQWNAPASSARPDGAEDAASGTAARIVDVKAERVGPEARRKNPAQPLTRETSNIFLSQPPAMTYAPPLAPGQAPRLIQFSASPGQKLDVWA